MTVAPLFAAVLLGLLVMVTVWFGSNMSHAILSACVLATMCVVVLAQHVELVISVYESTYTRIESYAKA